MIPILYEKGSTDFTHNGIGFLVDCISCEVTEERNGVYEAILTYPIEGALYEYIEESCLIKLKPNETSNLQLFRIYSHSKPINGVVTFNAEHISYELNGIPLAGLELKTSSPVMAINKAIQEGAFESGYSAWSDISTLNSISLEAPCSIRAALGGQEGSILDVWGGEYEFDNKVIKLHSHRGSNNGVVIEYGKNLVDVQQEKNITDTYTHIMPYALYTEEITDDHGTVIDTREVYVYLTEKVIALPAAENLGHSKALIVDLSGEFGDNEDITENSLRTKAAAYIQKHPALGTPSVSITASFVQLWQTEEYKAIAPLERVRLCDTVTVRFVRLGIEATAKVIKTVYDTLNEKYISVELGEARSNFADSVVEQNKRIAGISGIIKKGLSNASEEIRAAIENATNLITGNAGGYVVLYPAEMPEEILILDAPTLEEAVHVWRWNSSGLGYSSTGYNGQYGLAMTMDGAIVADFITAGTINGALLRADSVQANAISQGFKTSITNEINSTHETITQEFTAADEALRSSIETEYTDDIAASETRTQTLIGQTRDQIMLSVYTKTETSGLIDDAIDDANGYTDAQLGGYYTKSETDSKISVSAQNIMLNVYTKTETSGLIDDAVDDANDYTDTQLGGYYTKSETDSAISASASSLTLSFNTKLSNQYYTKTETDSQISLSEQGVKTTVSKAQSKYDESGYTIQLYGYGTPSSNGYAAADFTGWYYLNQNDGRLYTSNGSTWTSSATLELITKTLQAQITVNANNISSKVSSGDVVSEINQSSDTISLTAGRLLITTGNFKLNSSGTITAASATLTAANVSGTITTTSGDYTTKLSGGLLECWYQNNLRMTAGIYISSYASQYCLLGGYAKDGIAFGIKTSGGGANTYLRINNADALSYEECRLHFIGDVKFTGGQFKNHINFSNNNGLQWGGNIGLRYANTDVYGISENGLYLGLTVNSCPTFISAGGDIHLTAGSSKVIKNHSRVYFYSGGTFETGVTYFQSKVQISDEVILQIGNETGIYMGNNRSFAWVNGRGVCVGIDTASLQLYGSNVYANGSPVATTSDSRKKEDISALDSKYLQMIKAISPVSFKFDSEISLSGRTHTGFIAQNVLEAMTAAGIETTDFAAFVDVYGDGTEYALRYEEFISPMLAYIKELEARIIALETERTG